MTHADLIERLESLTMWDRETDALLSRHLAAGDAKAHWYDFHGKWTSDDTTPSYTGSIDAAVALVDKLLKIYSLRITIDPSGNGASINWWPHGLSGDLELGPFEGVSVSPEIAILISLLRALEPRP